MKSSSKNWIVARSAGHWYAMRLGYGPEPCRVYDPHDVSHLTSMFFQQYRFSAAEARAWVNVLNSKGDWKNVGDVPGNPVTGARRKKGDEAL